MVIVAVTTKGRERPRRFKGIVKAASDLRVSREHLYLVLTGQRKSPRIERIVQVIEENPK